MDGIGGLIMAFLCVGSVALGIFIGKDVSYKQGQIDAINGIIKYELVTQPDSTKVWTDIE